MTPKDALLVERLRGLYVLRPDDRSTTRYEPYVMVGEQLLNEVIAALLSAPDSERERVIEECARVCDEVARGQERNRDAALGDSLRLQFNAGMSAAGICAQAIRALLKEKSW